MTAVREPVAEPAREEAEDLVLEVRGLCVDYGVGPGATRAVRSVDLGLRRGEVLGLAGESGSGKSTLVYGATRLLPPPGVVAAGSVRYRAEPGAEPVEVLDLPDEELRRFRWAETAIVFQGAMNSLNPVLSVSAQLDDVLRAHRPRMAADERAGRVRELLHTVGIPADRAGSHPHQLSGGMRQRVMIAMALVLDPEVVILDEPTTALDVVVQRHILRRLVELRGALRFSVVFITHDLSLLVEFADRIAIMYGGRIVELATAEELYSAPRHPYTEGLLRSFPNLRGPRRALTGIPGSPPDPRRLPSGCSFRPRCPHAMDVCADEVPVLAPGEAERGSERRVACWLHPPVPGADPPDPRSVPTPAADPGAA